MASDDTAIDMQAPAIDSARLWQRHLDMAAIGAIDGGGCCRLCMTPEDGQARDLFRTWCEAAGLELRIDRVGNMFAIRAGQDNSAPIVVTGSHLDTQPHGGRFDGVSGVLCALEVMETLNDHDITTPIPLAIVNWTNEEGVRYAPGLTGSSWFIGALSDEEVYEAQADDSARFEDDARSLGYLGSLVPTDLPIAAFYELHIEQGPILENASAQIGIVESVQGLRWLDVDVIGMDAHAGTTPLDQRQDTIQASARMLVAMNDLGLQYAPNARVSVGRLTPATDGASTIAGRTQFVVDIRHPDATTLNQLAEQATQLCIEQARSQRCDATVTQRLAIEPSVFDNACVDRVDHAARQLGYQALRMTSGALHDASNLATVAPSAMIFIPCKDGISHNVLESATPEDLAAGCNVLLQAVLRSAGETPCAPS